MKPSRTAPAEEGRLVRFSVDEKECDLAREPTDEVVKVDPAESVEEKDNDGERRDEPLVIRVEARGSNISELGSPAPYEVMIGGGNGWGGGTGGIGKLMTGQHVTCRKYVLT